MRVSRVAERRGKYFTTKLETSANFAKQTLQRETVSCLSYGSTCSSAGSRQAVVAFGVAYGFRLHQAIDWCARISELGAHEAADVGGSGPRTVVGIGPKDTPTLSDEHGGLLPA